MTLYLPEGRSFIANLPRSSVCVVRAFGPGELVTLTLTPGSPLPLVSRTVPDRRPDCALRIPAHGTRAASTIASSQSARRVTSFPLQRPRDESGCFAHPKVDAGAEAKFHGTIWAPLRDQSTPPRPSPILDRLVIYFANDPRSATFHALPLSVLPRFGYLPGSTAILQNRREVRCLGRPFIVFQQDIGRTRHIDVILAST